MPVIAKKKPTKSARKKSPSRIKATVETQPVAEHSQPAQTQSSADFNDATADIKELMILLYESPKPENQLTAFEKIDIVKEGISKKALELFKLKAGLDYNQLADILSVARATLINKKGTSKFNSTLSEKILGLADIYSYGYEVFEDRKRFNQWIFRPNKALGGQAPYDLLDTQYGREEVRNIIGRIDFGVYS